MGKFGSLGWPTLQGAYTLLPAPWDWAGRTLLCPFLECLTGIPSAGFLPPFAGLPVMGAGVKAGAATFQGLSEASGH